MDAKQKAQVEKEVMQALDEYFAAARQCDAGKFMARFVDSEDMCVIENDEIRPSRKIFAEWIDAFFEGVVELDAVAEESRVFPLSSDVAVASGVFRYSARTTSDEVVDGRNAFTFVFVKQGGRWLINNVHESSLPVETEE